MTSDDNNTQELQDLLKLPVEEQVHSESFDPWRPFYLLYGSYSSAFDDMAITTLRDILNRTYSANKEYELASEMFREMLCNKDWCDYGTSPRTCWANEDFEKLLPEYIEKWEQYYEKYWGENYDN